MCIRKEKQEKKEACFKNYKWEYNKTKKKK